MALENLDFRLGQSGREAIRQEWQKAQDRMNHDSAGAITSARTMLECVCIYVLDVLGVEDSSSGDLPKLYSLAAAALGLAANNQISQINKRLFGSVHTIVQAVGELRNKAGDAHGRMGGRVPESAAQAEMAVYLAASISNFLLASVDSYISTAHRRTPDGGAILKFDRAMVWRLVDHARNAPTSIPSYGEKRAKPALWLVGDSGVYLMSNGSPPLLANGRITDPAKAEQSLRLVAYAEGCGPGDELDNWWPIHNAIAEGSDFSITIRIAEILPALERCDRQIVVVGTEEELEITADTD